MAGLGDILRKGVAIANRVTADLQMDVQYEAIKRVSTGGSPLLNGAGENDWEFPVPLTAVVEQKQELKRAADGTERMSHYKMTLMRSDLVIDVHDRFTFTDDNQTPFPPILTTRAALDNSGNAYSWEIWF